MFKDLDLPRQDRAISTTLTVRDPRNLAIEVYRAIYEVNREEQAGSLAVAWSLAIHLQPGVQVSFFCKAVRFANLCFAKPLASFLLDPLLFTSFVVNC